MSRILVIGLLACLAGVGPVRAQSNSAAVTHIRLDQAAEQLEKQGDALNSTLTKQIESLSKETEKAPANTTNPWIFVAVGLGIVIAFRTLGPVVATHFSERAKQPKPAVEEPVETPNVGVIFTTTNESARTVQQDAMEKEARACEAEPLEEFFRTVGQDLASLRKSLCDLGRTAANDEQKKLLQQLLEQIVTLKAKSNLSAIRPLLQFAHAIEGLLNQLTGESEVLKPSTLRTLASAIDLLHSLSVRGLRPDLGTEPEPRLLAVDDDPVSRFAVAASMKRFLVKPDTATHGEAALALAEETAYDLIFLDVQMPGMDGFELCSRIHATARNRTTPIVFVTCQSDFDARAKSSLTGGQDLIGKPFLASELSLKALTLVLRRRLQGEAAPSRTPSQSTTPSAQPPKATPSKAFEPRTVLEPALAAAAGAPA